jgi:hypothetical protein
MGNKRYHIVLASIGFAVLTWISVNMRHDYVVVRHLPIVIENLKAGKALKHPLPKSVSVRFSGSGWLLAGLYLTPGLTYFIDASSLTSEPFVITSKDLLEHVKLPFAVQAVDSKPDTLILALDDYVEKRVPVISRVVTDFHSGYGQVGIVQITPDSITIGGGKEAIEQLSMWHTIYEKLSDLKSSVDIMLSLEDPVDYSMAVLQKNVRLQINVQPFAEKVFSGIPVSSTLTPSNREVIFIPPKMDVVVRGGIDQLAKYSNKDFAVTISYEYLVQDSSEYVSPLLTSPPEVNVVSRKPERFQYIIRKRLQ